MGFVWAPSTVSRVQRGSFLVRSFPGIPSGGRYGTTCMEGSVSRGPLLRALLGVSCLPSPSLGLPLKVVTGPRDDPPDPGSLIRSCVRSYSVCLRCPGEPGTPLTHDHISGHVPSRERGSGGSPEEPVPVPVHGGAYKCAVLNSNHFWSLLVSGGVNRCSGLEFWSFVR